MPPNQNQQSANQKGQNNGRKNNNNKKNNQQRNQPQPSVDDDVEEIPRTFPPGQNQPAMVQGNNSEPVVEIYKMTLSAAIAFSQQSSATMMSMPAQPAPVQRKFLEATGARKGNSKGKGKEGKDDQKSGESSKKSEANAIWKDKPMAETICGNCERKGHWLLRCVGPVNDYGFIWGCPWCNVNTHILEQCSSFDSSKPEDRERFVKNMTIHRQNRPPLASSVAANEFPETQEGGKYYRKMPWTTDFSWQYQFENPDYWKNYQYALLAKDDPILFPWDDHWEKAITKHILPNKVIHIGQRVQALRPPRPQKRSARQDEESSKRPRLDGEDHTMGGTNAPNNPQDAGQGDQNPPANDRQQNDGQGRQNPTGAPATGNGSQQNAAEATGNLANLSMKDIMSAESANVTTRTNSRGLHFNMNPPQHRNPLPLQRRKNDTKHGGACSNCGVDFAKHLDKDGGRCDQPCGGCGDGTHLKQYCSWKAQHCVCKEFPRHVAEDCTILCPCTAESGLPPHSAVLSCSM
ncbi:hypothetical protein EG329_008531 [Mollisiaceae sp. DMI_Dod_QoI]|nr:hypothetical protein EG329_008531 [Helotiales sp. DMI_Dod_QoI]